MRPSRRSSPRPRGSPVPEPRVAVVGATGAVGPVVLEVMHERGFPAAEGAAFAAARGLAHVTGATFRAVSGTGARAVEELHAQSRALLDGETADPMVYPHPIAFNAVPHCDGFEGDSTLEETKLVRETHKILGDDS